MTNSEDGKVYQIKATLKHIQPPIWRRILVEDRTTLYELHLILQIVFDWDGSHMHDFTIQGVHYSDPDADPTGELDFEDETRVSLRRLNLRKGVHFNYQYDFGDSWNHILVVEKTLPFEPGMKLPRCMGGERAAPPEDSGGVWGYGSFLAAIQDPENEEHEQYLEWFGGTFDPEAFDLQEINQQLERLVENQGQAGDFDPALIEDALEDEESVYYPERWENLFSEADRQAAQAVALRQDVLRFLTYLKENKVTGTKRTGNLPRKAVADIAARFVTPPDLEPKIGDIVFRLRNEDEVWPVFFVHLLAEGAGLVSGGADQRWLVTPEGEFFLTLAPVHQLGFLFFTWVGWVRTPKRNFGTRYGDEDSLQSLFKPTIAKLLVDIPVGERVAFEPFAAQVMTQADDWSMPEDSPDQNQFLIREAVPEMSFSTFEEFGVLTIEGEQDRSQMPGPWLDRFALPPIPAAFTLTSLGHALALMIKGSLPQE